MRHSWTHEAATSPHTGGEYIISHVRIPPPQWVWGFSTPPNRNLSTRPLPQFIILPTIHHLLLFQDGRPTSTFPLARPRPCITPHLAIFHPPSRHSPSSIAPRAEKPTACVTRHVIASMRTTPTFRKQRLCRTEPPVSIRGHAIIQPGGKQER